MEGSTYHQTILSWGFELVLASPYWSCLFAFALIALMTRIKTGYLRSKLQDQTDTASKAIPILPYWLPYLGHGPAFGWDFDGLLARGRNTTKDGIFGLHMMGAQHYMVLMPSLTKQFFLQRPSVLSSDDFLFWIHDKVLGDGGAAKKITSDDFHTVHHTLNSLMKEPFLSTATQKTAELVEERCSKMLSFTATSNEQSFWQKAASTASDGTSIEADLFPLIMNFVGDISGTVFMGKQFSENNKGILEDMWVFDGGFNAFLTGVPTPTLRNAKGARRRLNEAIHEWNHAVGATLKGEEPDFKWGDLSDVSEPMKRRMKALQAIKSPDEFGVASQLAVYWGLMVNSNKVIFWMLLHIISTPALLINIREEIKPYATVSKDGKLKLDVDSLVKHCPLFKATYYESMRIYVAGTSYKKVLQDVTLTESDDDAQLLGKPRGQTYHIKKGNYLVIPHATMQMDPRLWEKPSEFSAERFLVSDEKDPKTVKADMRHLNVFGGGPGVCKGRLYAERELLIFVAGFLSMWDFEPVGNGWNDPGRYYNGTGTANPKRNIRVQISKRSL